MYQWGDPFAEDASWKSLKSGDNVRVRATCEPYAGRVGILEEIADMGDYLVNFGDGLTCGYDGDMLVRVPVEGEKS